MEREIFKLIACGQFALSKRQTGTIEIKEMDIFLDGALFTFDFIQKENLKLKMKQHTGEPHEPRPEKSRFLDC